MEPKLHVCVGQVDLLIFLGKNLKKKGVNCIVSAILVLMEDCQFL